MKKRLRKKILKQIGREMSRIENMRIDLLSYTLYPGSRGIVEALMPNQIGGKNDPPRS